MQYPSQHPKQASITLAAYWNNIRCNIRSVTPKTLLLRPLFALAHIRTYILANNLPNIFTLDTSSDIARSYYLWTIRPLPGVRFPDGLHLSSVFQAASPAAAPLPSAIPKTDVHSMSAHLPKFIARSPYYSSCIVPSSV